MEGSVCFVICKVLQCGEEEEGSRNIKLPYSSLCVTGKEIDGQGGKSVFMF